jgi:hypothetical protein
MAMHQPLRADEADPDRSNEYEATCRRIAVEVNEEAAEWHVLRFD